MRLSSRALIAMMKAELEPGIRLLDISNKHPDLVDIRERRCIARWLTPIYLTFWWVAFSFRLRGEDTDLTAWAEKNFVRVAEGCK